MTIRGKEINLGGPLVRLLMSDDPVAQRLRAVVAVGFFLAYLATAVIS